MGNQQPKSQPQIVEQVKAQPVITVAVEKKKYQIDQDCLIDQIQLEKPKIPNQKKSQVKNDKIIQKPIQNIPTQQEKLVRKNSSNQKQLPPLKVRNSRNIAPLGNCENINNQPNIFQDIQQIHYEKKNQKNIKAECIYQKSIQRNRSDEKQNGQISRDISKTSTRTKKFRPSDTGRKNSSTLSSYINDNGDKKQILAQ